MSHQAVIVLNFGDQYSQLTVRRVRKCGVYYEVKPCTTPLEKPRTMEPIGFIFTGGPSSVYETGASKADPTIFEPDVPVLGICYSCQFMVHVLGDQVTETHEDTAREYGKTGTYYDTTCKLFKGLPERGISWMNHGDYMVKVPEGFALAAHSGACPNIAITDEKRGFYGVQCHSGINHTEHGVNMIHNFLYEVCGTKGDWTAGNYKGSSIRTIREKVGGGKMLLALPGSVDSSVAVALLTEAMGSQLTCVLVDHGLMRKGEGNEVETVFSKWNVHFVWVDAEACFLEKPSDVSEPERKRRIIGGEFICVFEEEAKKVGQVDYLMQDTICPDVIESGAGDTAVIKSHRNVDGLPDYVNFRGIIEPLCLLFKDEVWQLGRELGLPECLVMRQPFPGLDLAIRVIGDLTKERLDTLRDADAIYRRETAAAGEDKNINQYFTVLANTHSTGVMGDGRTYDYILALHTVTTSDFMTADWARIPYDVLDKISTRIVNEVKGINRIVYDITSKPLATIEWEQILSVFGILKSIGSTAFFRIFLFQWL